MIFLLFHCVWDWIWKWTLFHSVAYDCGQMRWNLHGGIACILHTLKGDVWKNGNDKGGWGWLSFNRSWASSEEFYRRLCGRECAGVLAIFTWLAFLDKSESNLQSTQVDMKSKEIATMSAATMAHIPYYTHLLGAMFYFVRSQESLQTLSAQKTRMTSDDIKTTLSWKNGSLIPSPSLTHPTHIRHQGGDFGSGVHFICNKIHSKIFPFLS